MTTTMMVSRIGDLNLNITPPPDYEDPVKEGLRQAMVQHEIVFTHQVQELHRLYWTQKSLMNDLCLMRSDSISTSDVQRHCKGPAVEKKTSEMSAVDSMEIVDPGIEAINGLSEETGSGFYQRVSGHVEIDSGALEAKVNGPHGFKAFAHNAVNINPSQVTVSSEFCLVKGMWSESGHRSTDKCSHAEHLTRWHKNSGHSDVGVEEHGTPLSATSPSEKQKPICKLPYFDLNIAQDDDSFNDYPNTIEIFASPPMSSSVVQHGINLSPSNAACLKESEPGNRSASESTAMVQIQSCIVSLDLETSRGMNADSLACEPRDSYPSSVQTSVQSSVVENYINYKDCDMDKRVHRSGAHSPEECSKDFESCKREKGDTYLANNKSISRSSLENNCLHATAGSGNLPPKATRGLKKKETHKEGSEEDTSSSHVIVQQENQQDESPEFPTVTEFNQLTGDIECTLEKRCTTKHVFSNSENSGTSWLFMAMPEKIHRNEDPRVDVLHPIDDFLQKVTDNIIVKAAEALLSISSENLLTSAELREPESVDAYDQPQFSDSYETITLNLQEIIDDGNSIYAGRSDNGIRKEISGSRLRRGARDFQKDILPGIISLSRHEICEDLHAIKCGLRKDQCTREDNFTVPARSRRSRIYTHHK